MKRWITFALALCAASNICFRIAGATQNINIPSGGSGTTGATGATGAAGSNGAQGSTGATGASGTNGSNGAAGATGATGASGSNGSNGAAGQTGATGASGTNGSNGAAGASGATGSTGTTGASGPSYNIGTIDTQTASSDGAVIAGTGIFMQSASTGAPGLVSTGAQGFTGAKTFNGGVTVASGQALTLSGASASRIAIVNASSQVTTSGSSSSMLGNQSANTFWAGPTSGAAAATSFRTQVPADSLFGWLSKTASYTLGVADYGVTFSGSAGAMTATLPTAASVAGQTYKIVNNDTTNTVTINTTSAQTVGGRASGNIVLAAACGDLIEVYSDGSNWQIVAKKETKIFANSGSKAGIASGITGIYESGSANAALTPGTWRITGFYSFIMAAASPSNFFTFGGGTGIYASDGGNNSSIPTSLTGPTGFQLLTGWGGSAQWGGATGYGSNGLIQVGPVFITISSNTTVYAVMQLTTVGSGGNISTGILAERVW